MSLGPRRGAERFGFKPCIRGGGTDLGLCHSYLPGHRMHPIQAVKVGQTPWGWLDAIVDGVDAAGVIHLTLLEGDEQAVAWHHQALVEEVAVGEPVRLHTRHHTLATTQGWLSVLLISAPRSADEPPHPDVWKPEATAGIVDLRTGRGFTSW